jgi:hypothetical protein
MKKDIFNTEQFFVFMKFNQQISMIKSSLHHSGAKISSFSHLYLCLFDYFYGIHNFFYVMLLAVGFSEQKIWRHEGSEEKKLDPFNLRPI